METMTSLLLKEIPSRWSRREPPQSQTGQLERTHLVRIVAEHGELGEMNRMVELYEMLNH